MYRYYNNNPRGNNISDCVIRAVALAENISWSECQEKMSTLARKRGQMLDSVEFVENYLDYHYPRQCHVSKTIGEFTKECSVGVYLATMNGHITCIIDGDVYDTFDCSDRVMRCSWCVEK